MLAEKLREDPDHKATADASEASGEHWQAYVDQILMPVAVGATAERYAPRAVLVIDEGQITRSFEFAQDGEDGLKLEPSDFIGLDLGKELFVSVEWLYEFKQLFLLGVETYKALLLAHLVLLLLSVALMVAEGVA